MKNKFGHFVSCLLLVVVLLSLVGCKSEKTTKVEPTQPPATAVPTQPPATEAPTQPPPTVAPTQPPPTVAPTQPPEPVNLTLWYLSGSPQEMDIITKAVADYVAAHPGVTIDLSFYDFPTYQTTLKLAMDSGTGPDLFYGDWGPAGGLAFAQAGMLVDLTEIVPQYGWDKRLGTPLPWSWYWDALTPGHYYGIPYDYTTVGVYYNKTIFNELGLKPPTTFAEMETLLATLKAEKPDIAPISVGAGEGWPLGHVFGQIEHGCVPFEELQKFALFPGAGGDMNQPGYVEAMQILQDWGKKGYFQENYLAASGQDMIDMFLAGKAVIMIAGTWNSGAVSTITDFEVGFFGTPPVHPDLNPDGAWHLGGFSINNPWYVNAASKYQDEVLELLDYMLDKDVAVALWTGMADTVAYHFAEGEAPAPVYPFQQDIYETMQAAQGGFYIGIPGYDTQYNGILQAVASGEMTPEDAVAQMADLYARALSENQP